MSTELSPLRGIFLMYNVCMQETILLNYLKKQHVSKEIADKKGITVDGRNRIVIPIRDGHGARQYNKYRSNPEADRSSNGEPKYTYDAGSTARLYNSEVLEPGYAEANGLDPTKLIICEGEFKALCFETLGYMAVSGTGGAHTWSEDWLREFYRLNKSTVTTYLCFDNDKAGTNAVFKVAAKLTPLICSLPKIISLIPVSHGKDINDFARQFGADYVRKAIEEAREYETRFKESFTKKSEIREELGRINRLLEQNRMLVREMLGNIEYNDSDSIYISTYNDILIEQHRRLKRLLNIKGRIHTSDNIADTIKIAKSVPIPLFVKFNERNYAHSLWNENDHTPSMYYNQNGNWVYDFSTGQSADAIKVYMHIRKVNFITAIKELIKISHGN